MGAGSAAVISVICGSGEMDSIVKPRLANMRKFGMDQDDLNFGATQFFCFALNWRKDFQCWHEWRGWTVQDCHAPGLRE